MTIVVLKAWSFLRMKACTHNFSSCFGCSLLLEIICQSQAGYGNLRGVEVFPYIGYPTSVAADASTGRTFVEGKAFAGWLKLKAALLWGIFFMYALLHREPSWRRLTGLSHCFGCWSIQFVCKQEELSGDCN